MGMWLLWKGPKSSSCVQPHKLYRNVPEDVVSVRKASGVTESTASPSVGVLVVSRNRGLIWALTLSAACAGESHSLGLTLPDNKRTKSLTLDWTNHVEEEWNVSLCFTPDKSYRGRLHKTDDKSIQMKQVLLSQLVLLSDPNTWNKY